jgi:hypothetical protein
VHLCHPLTISGVIACPLRQNQNEPDRRGNWTAQGEAALLARLTLACICSGLTAEKRASASLKGIIDMQCYRICASP